MTKFLKKIVRWWGKAPDDQFRNRRNLAFFSAIWSFIIWPHELLYLRLVHRLDVDTVKAMLIYICTLATGTIGGWIWAALRDDKKKRDDADAENVSE